MTDATDADYRALHAICDRAGITVMSEAIAIGAFPAVSLRCMIIYCAVTMDDLLGKDAVAAFLMALAENVLRDGDDDAAAALNAAGAALDTREAQIRAAAAGRKQ